MLGPNLPKPQPHRERSETAPSSGAARRRTEQHLSSEGSGPEGVGPDGSAEAGGARSWMVAIRLGGGGSISMVTLRRRRATSRFLRQSGARDGRGLASKTVVLDVTGDTDLWSVAPESFVNTLPLRSCQWQQTNDRAMWAKQKSGSNFRRGAAWRRRGAASCPAENGVGGPDFARVGETWPSRDPARGGGKAGQWERGARSASS